MEPVVRKCLSLLFLILVLVPVLGLHPLAANAEVVAIRADRLVDTERGSVLLKPTVIVRDTKIEMVGSDLAIPKTARVIDLPGKTILPGLIDCHTHLTDETVLDPVVELQRTAAQKAFESIPYARRTVMAGFTTVRDVGTYRALVDVALRDAIARGDVLGPRMFVAGAYVTITGGAGSLSGFAPDITVPWDLRFGQADGPWQVRQRIRELAHRKADFIKILATGAVLTHGSNPGAQEFTFEEMKAAVEEAGKFGLKVAAHAHSAAGIKEAVRAGVASIEHGTHLDDEGIALMKEHGTYLVADIYNDEYIQGEGKKRGMPKDFLEHDQDLGRIQRENFRKAVRAGVKMAFGTDAGVFPHGQNARQFAWMVKYGMTPLQAVQSATIDAARLLGQDAELGSLTAGKRADIIAVEGDPMADVSLLEKVDFVMKDGAIIKNSSGSKAGSVSRAKKQHTGAY